jgi:hypothetical protein
LRERLWAWLVQSGLRPAAARALATALPEDLFEGSIFQVNLFMRLIPPNHDREICSEDLIENISSTCLVAVALERGWKFTFKEHAVPSLIFTDHPAWYYAKISSRIILTEDYIKYIDREVRDKCLYLNTYRRSRFKFDPGGKRVLCLPFIFEKGWFGAEDYFKDTCFDRSDLGKIECIISQLLEQGDILIKYHPLHDVRIPLENLPRATFDDSAIKEAIFIGWTQGLYECMHAGIPARILLIRPLTTLTHLGKIYLGELERAGSIQFVL